MNTSIVEKRLADKSVIYSVVFCDGSLKAEIDAVTLLDAERIANVLQYSALSAHINPASFEEYAND